MPEKADDFRELVGENMKIILIPFVHCLYRGISHSNEGVLRYSAHQQAPC